MSIEVKSMDQNCRCLELEERVLKGEEKYTELETELQKQNKECESLELRIKELESEKLVVEEELRNLKESEESSLVEQMMVNGALEIEKQVAVKEAEDWKSKFEKLVETVRKLDEIGGFRYGELELDENVKLGLELARIKDNTESCKVDKDSLSREGLGYHQGSGSPYMTTPVKDYYILGRDRDNMSSRGRVNKMLSFEDDDGDKSTGVVDLCDGETEERSEKESTDAKDALEERRSIDENYEDEDVESCEADKSTPCGRKRKRVIASDSETDDDNDDEDNIPISILKNLKPSDQEMVDTPTKGESGSRRLSGQPRRVSSRLRKQRVSEEISAPSEKNSPERAVGIPTIGNAEDDETEEEPESESASLNGFIVSDDDDDSQVSVSESSDHETGEEESDGETGYADVMSRLRRDKKPEKRKWEYEADMLADIGKDPELCMRAVCVMYRLQTEDEKLSSSSRICNGIGFNKFDAARGTYIASFLTDGDPKNDLKKSVEELEDFDYKAVEDCEKFACRYWKQLFKIYNNRDDPFFARPPSP
ncbi:PREDICTED: uncharacterized protein LOC104725839 isoform X2 [Camelina sativa]|uniref:Uncharacterized protein LOC104725839 isoform X2 n=1 Tax=Camelina sativa TaxID=90675 RepID=A0ABM0ULF0_CAMSA|nr:PREDICTED: uncharacterized protein LOC104725839 isoform X2 [Camelina sativa]